ncbi:hypothetical protein L211DRAFT_851374 [Terfezia boudieri ATCC MYA-4762]|uniref:Uncharacterized protein n=1 Tax=Terfezia boudieri ATCC MYA-4762 TaxID=1051890 RepID=A0A3N4LFK1_9PEZI|nr:hypothetical protein L211DRAFT_851374 [Terfezia boudieri ATCC MYA-4762]
MGMKNTAVNQPHTSIHSQEASHGLNTPVEPSSSLDPYSSPSLPTPLDPPQPTPADSRPSMDVKALIQFFNNRNTSPVPKPPVITRQPAFNLNGKVKNLVREFSKSTQSLADPRHSRPFGQVKKVARATQAEPAIDQLQIGGGAAGNGVSQGSGGSGQASKEGSSTGYVASVQLTDPPKQPDSEDQPSQQHQEPAEAAVESVQNVTHKTASTPTRPEYNEQGLGPKRAGSVTSTSTTSHSKSLKVKQWNCHTFATPIRLGDMLSTIDRPVAVFQKQNRPDSLDSVVMSARNSELRNTKSTGLALSGIERYESVLFPLPLLGLETAEEQPVPRTPNKSTEPPPLKIVKVRKSEYAAGSGLNTFGCYEHPPPPPPKVPFLAPPAQQFIEPQQFARSSQAPSISDSISIPPERSIFHRRSSARKGWQNRRIEARRKRGETGSQVLLPVTPSIVLKPPVERAGTKDKNSGARESSRLPSTRAYQTLPHKGSPRRRIYDDTGWVNHNHQALRKSMGQTRGDAHCAIDTLDCFSLSPTSWSTATAPEDSPSVAETTSFIHSPLSPPRAPSRSIIMGPDDTAGKYHPLSRRKSELIRPLPDPFFVEQIGLQQFNSRFSTFTKQESFSDASFVTIDQEAPTVRSEVGPKPPAEAKDPRRLGSAYQSPVPRILAREDVTSRAAGLMSPSYVVAEKLSRALSHANSVDMENKRYSRRR